MRANQKSPSVYVFDAPITKFRDPVTVKILVCDTQSLGQSNIETLINRIKSQDGAPIVYIFSEVNPATLKSINTCFNDNSHWIFEQACRKSENQNLFANTKLVTLFNKSAMSRDQPKELKIDSDGQLIHSFGCRLASSAEGSQSFVLHAAHLNLGNKYRIRDVEEAIRTKISDICERNEYPQILAGDLGMPILAGDSWSPRIAALTWMPPTPMGIIFHIDNRNVKVTPFQQIDPESAQPYIQPQNRQLQKKSRLVPLSWFGVKGKHLYIIHGLRKRALFRNLWVLLAPKPLSLPQ